MMWRTFDGRKDPSIRQRLSRPSDDVRICSRKNQKPWELRLDRADASLLYGKNRKLWLGVETMALSDSGDLKNNQVTVKRDGAPFAGQGKA